MLAVRELTKSFNGAPAVDKVSFAIKPHEVLGYLGPNGSGKTTTVRMLTGLLPPTAGDIFFDGQDVRHHLVEYKQRLGYVPEEAHVYSYLSGREFLELTGRLRSMSQPLLEEKIELFLELFALRRHQHSPLSSYSKGMKQRILISAALLHNPDLLIFDEPLSGLDVTSALVFRHIVKLLAGEGKTILYGSHVLEVVEKLCCSVVILRKGSIVAHNSVERLRDLMKLPSLEDVFAQLAVQEDPEKVARDVVEVMKL